MAPNGGVEPRRFDYVPTLDGWRAIAVVAVICFHCAKNKSLWPGSLFWKVGLRGNLGVDIFFAISGFLICGKLLQELRVKQRISLKSFYIRRCFRIFPALWCYLGVLAILTTFGWVSSHVWEYSSTVLFIRNYFPLYHDFVLGPYTAQFWSLGVEEQFYLIWAALIFLVGPKVNRVGWATLVLALGVFVWRSIDSSYNWLVPFGTDINTKTDTRIDALLWGCLAAIVYPSLQARLKRWTLGYGTWVLIAFLVATIDVKVVEFSLIRVILFPALLLSTAMSPQSMISRFLEWPFMRWIGRMSYSIYIWQQLAIFPTGIAHSPLAVIQRFPYHLPIIFILAALSYYLVELPMIRLGKRVAKYFDTPREKSGEALGFPETSAA